MSLPIQGDVVAIKFRDSASPEPYWAALDDAVGDDLSTTIAVGFLIECNADHFSIVQSWDDTDPDAPTVGGRLTIPRGAVIGCELVATKKCVADIRQNHKT